LVRRVVNTCPAVKASGKIYAEGAFIIPMSNTAKQIDLASAVSRLRASRARPQERRRFRRLDVIVGGKMLDPLGQEHDCRTADMSPGDARIIAPVLPDVGQRVVLYLEGYGRVAGHVTRRGAVDAAIVFDLSAHKREKLAESLTLAINKDLGVEADTRAPPRLIESGLTSTARIELDSGAVYEAEVLDFSLTGIVLRTHRAAPTIGAWVRIGGTYGRVSRLIENGFAVDFEPGKRLTNA
jgi:PilZ domain